MLYKTCSYNWFQTQLKKRCYILFNQTFKISLFYKVLFVGSAFQKNTFKKFSLRLTNQFEKYIYQCRSNILVFDQDFQKYFRRKLFFLAPKSKFDLIRFSLLDRIFSICLFGYSVMSYNIINIIKYLYFMAILSFYREWKVTILNLLKTYYLK